MAWGCGATPPAPMTADGVRVPRGAMLGTDGAGLDLALTAVLPVFLIGNAANEHRPDARASSMRRHGI